MIGNSKVRGDHTEEVKVTIDSFFKEIRFLLTIKMGYHRVCNKLLSSLTQYPQYHRLVTDLLHIIKKEDLKRKITQRKSFKESKESRDLH